MSSAFKFPTDTPLFGGASWYKGNDLQMQAGPRGSWFGDLLNSVQPAALRTPMMAARGAGEAAPAVAAPPTPASHGGGAASGFNAGGGKPVWIKMVEGMGKVPGYTRLAQWEPGAVQAGTEDTLGGVGPQNVTMAPMSPSSPAGLDSNKPWFMQPPAAAPAASGPQNPQPATEAPGLGGGGGAPPPAPSSAAPPPPPPAASGTSVAAGAQPPAPAAKVDNTPLQSYPSSRWAWLWNGIGGPPAAAPTPVPTK